MSRGPRKGYGGDGVHLDLWCEDWSFSGSVYTESERCQGVSMSPGFSIVYGGTATSCPSAVQNCPFAWMAKVVLLLTCIHGYIEFNVVQTPRCERLV